MSKKNPIFCIQKHDASRLHYDFRLEVNGVLKSWAVPKGPSLNPGDKRLAIMTTDHALSHANFEGIIPEGEYGAGVVMVWDRGHYKNIKPVNMEKSLKNGQIEVFLEGEKLQGGYALVRMKGANWLLIKMNDEYANRRKNVTKSELRSAKTGRTLSEIKKDSKS